MRARRIARITGVLSGMLGLAALGTALFAPLNMVCYSGTPSPLHGGCQPISLVQQQGLSSLAFAITLFGGLSLGILLFSLWHSLTQSILALVLLWACTVLLFGATVLALLSIGLLFVPALVLALVSSIVSTVAPRQRVPAHV
jgi:hypothetical protein